MEWPLVYISHFILSIIKKQLIGQDEAVVLGAQAAVIHRSSTRLDLERPGRNLVFITEVLGRHADPRPDRIRVFGISTAGPVALQRERIVETIEGRQQLRLNRVAPRVERAAVRGCCLSSRNYF